MRRTWWLLAGLGTACATGPTAQRDALEQARQRWAEHGATRYEFTAQRGCFCAGPLRVRVQVNQTVIVRTDLDTGQPVLSEFGALFPDVPGLFTLIEEELRRPAASVAVTYHGALGYPMSIVVDRIRNAIDDEYSYTITDLVLLP